MMRITSNFSAPHLQTQKFPTGKKPQSLAEFKSQLAPFNEWKSRYRILTSDTDESLLKIYDSYGKSLFKLYQSCNELEEYLKNK